MFALARTLRPQVLSPTFQCRRWFAEIVYAPLPAPPAPPELSSQDSLPVPSSAATPKAVDWRKERVPVKEDHGLYAFFRRKQIKPGAEEPQGEEKYEVLEIPQDMQVISGRGWKAEELRLKSFKDLHTLWYVLLRERNLLASQKEETRRIGVENKDFQVNGTRVYHVRKSMARIKQVLNERRLAYERATELAKKQQDAYHNVAVMKHFEKKRENEIIQKRITRKELRRKAGEARARKTAQQAASRAKARGRFFGRRREGATQAATTSLADTPELSTA